MSCASDMETPIADFVARYAKEDISRLHMPGHKGMPMLGCEPLDITEIHGADELYDAEGIIAQSEANATQIFGTAGTYYSTEGSSQCIRTMLFLALQAAPGTGRRPVLLAARNAHKALIYAAALLDFDIRWLWPEAGADDSLCACPVTPAQLALALERAEKDGIQPFGVYITSPDYLGGVQPVSALADVCRSAGVPLLVDNAHGAYLHFLPQGSSHPIAQGAAFCCDSAHKTLPVLTGGAYLHIGPTAPVKDISAVKNSMALFGSTSPSYLTLQSLDLCNKYLSEDYRSRLAACIQRMDSLKAELNEAAAAHGLAAPVRPSEPLKLTIDAAALGRTGESAAAFLRAGKIEPEYVDSRYIVLMVTPENTEQDFKRLRETLLALIAQAVGRSVQAASIPSLAQLRLEAKQQCTIRQAVFSPQCIIPVEDAVGHICALPMVSCPPAIPIAVSGERIGPAAAQLFEAYGIKEIAVIRE